MKRSLPMFAAAVVLAGMTGQARAHPGNPSSYHTCPCLSLDGTGSKSGLLTLTRAVTIYQNDVDPTGDSSTLSGWVMQSANGIIVAARLYVADGVVYSHSVREAASVRLPAGKYRLTRLSTTSHRIDIPIVGIPAIRMRLTAQPAVSARYTLSQPAPSPVALTTLRLTPQDKLLFLEARQEASTHLSLSHCQDDSCTQYTSDPVPGSTYPYAPNIEVALPLSGGSRTSITLAQGSSGSTASSIQITVSGLR